MSVDGALDAHPAIAVADGYGLLGTFAVFVAVGRTVVSERVAPGADLAVVISPARHTIEVVRAIGNGRRGLLTATVAPRREPTAGAPTGATTAADSTVPPVAGHDLGFLLRRQKVERLAATPEPYEKDEEATK